MYEAFYGLRERPFELTPNPRFLLMTPRHREALTTLEYGLTARTGIALLLGEAGTGKTTIVHAALQSQRVAQSRAVYLNNPALTRTEFVEFLAAGFGLSGDAARSKTRCLSELTEVLAPLSRRDHRSRERQHAGPDARGLGMRGADDHPFAGGQMAGGRCAAHALDVDETGPAGAERRAVRILAELRQRDAEAVDRIQHGGAGVELDRPIVDNQLHGGLIIKDKPVPGNRVSDLRDARRYNTPARRRTSQ